MRNVLHIRHLKQRTRIRGMDASVVRQRVNRALANMLNEGLEEALLHAGIDTDEEVCIRRLHTRIKLDLARSDLQLSADWSIAWIDDLRMTLQSGGDNVVRYRSRLHVLMDVATRMLRGDDSRTWAWRQLRVWPELQIDSAHARGELARVLTRHPTAVLPVCQLLAQQQLLGSWVAALPQTELHSVTSAALQAAEINPEVLTRQGAKMAGVEELDTASQIRISQRMAASPLRDELLAVTTETNVTELAALVMLDVEPAMRSLTVPWLRMASTQLLSDSMCHSHVVNDSHSRVASTQLLSDSMCHSYVVNDSHSRVLLAEEPEKVETHQSSDGPDAECRSKHSLRVHDESASSTSVRRCKGALNAISVIPPQTRGLAEAAEHQTPSTSDDELPEPSMETQTQVQYTHTRFGGLMYLLWLIEPTGVLDAVSKDAPFAFRGLRWSLRRLALQLLPLDEDDPVLNVFTGLPPWQPNADEVPAPSEAADIAVLSNRLVATLRARLNEPDMARDRLLDMVCRREAAIHFDPGWIELHFKLEAVSTIAGHTIVRRSGLDRDPGWVSWLGAVVRFAYV